MEHTLKQPHLEFEAHAFGINFLSNALLTVAGRINEIRKMGTKVELPMAVNLSDPFIRRSISSMFLPGIPLDKLFVGGTYLFFNGQNLVTRKDTPAK